MIVSKSKLCVKKWRDFILEKYDYKCALCGKNGGLVTHHIIPRQERPDLINETDNGIVLCRKCHIKEHQKRGEIKYQNINIKFLMKNVNKIFLTNYSQEELDTIQNRLYEVLLDDKFKQL